LSLYFSAVYFDISRLCSITKIYFSFVGHYVISSVPYFYVFCVHLISFSHTICLTSLLSSSLTFSLISFPKSNVVHASLGLILYYLSDYTHSSRIVSFTISIHMTIDMICLLSNLQHAVKTLTDSLPTLDTTVNTHTGTSQLFHLTAGQLRLAGELNNTWMALDHTIALANDHSTVHRFHSGHSHTPRSPDILSRCQPTCSSHRHFRTPSIFQA